MDRMIPLAGRSTAPVRAMVQVLQRAANAKSSSHPSIPSRDLDPDPRVLALETGCRSLRADLKDLTGSP